MNKDTKIEYKLGDRVKLLVDIDTNISTLKAGTVGTVCCFYPVGEGELILIGVDFGKTLIGLHNIGGIIKTNSAYLCKAEQLTHVNKILKIKEWLLQ